MATLSEPLKSKVGTMNTSTLLPDASEPRKIQLTDSLPLNADREGATEAELYNLIKVVLLDSSLSAAVRHWPRGLVIRSHSSSIRSRGHATGNVV